MDKVATAVVGGFIGVYLIRVGLAGNGSALLKELEKEGGYLQFLVALYALWLLHKYGPTHQITDALVTTAAVAVLLKVMASDTNVVATIREFATGRKTLFQTTKALFGN